MLDPGPLATIDKALKMGPVSKGHLSNSVGNLNITTRLAG
jgi:hypothetical protein